MRDQEPPLDFEDQLKKALRSIRIGDYDTAREILEPLRPCLPTRPPMLMADSPDNDYHRLRLATLLAEVAEYKGDYDDAGEVLRPYRGIVKDLTDRRKDDDSAFDFGDAKKNKHRLVLRQKLYYLWQQSVWRFRTGKIDRSKELLDLAIDLAERIDPPSETLLTQLYYGAGKLAFHICRESDAIGMYRRSLMSASDRLDIARHAHDKNASAPESNDAFMDNEVEAARYSVAKTLALGLGQCLREQGRLEEAHTQVLAGRILLNLGVDRELSQHARLLLGSIERSIAGEDPAKASVLVRSRKQIVAAVRHFKKHKGEVGKRARLELALVLMQQKKLGKAKARLQKMLEPLLDPQIEDEARDHKWIAEISLALSRVARREKAHTDAVRYAQQSVDAARNLERIWRRSQVVLVLALYDAAMASDGERRQKLLRQTETEIDRAMAPARDPDVRTRANMLLTKARVLKAKDRIADALDAYKEYEAIKPLVEVGRIHELAKIVERELEPVMDQFRCPADSVPADLDMERNLEAMEQYVRRKVERIHPNKTAQARAMGKSRAFIYRGPNKPSP